MNIYQEYVAAQKIKEAMAAMLKSITRDNPYVEFSTKLGIPDERFRIERAKFDIPREQAEAELSEWKKAHWDFYRMQTCLPSSSWIDSIFPDISGLTLEQLALGYKRAGEVLKGIPNSALDIYCTEIRPMLNAEHRDEWQAAKEAVYKNYGVPTDDQLKNSLRKEEIPTSRIKMNRQPCSDASVYNELIIQIAGKLKEM